MWNHRHLKWSQCFSYVLPRDLSSLKSANDSTVLGEPSLVSKAALFQRWFELTRKISSETIPIVYCDAKQLASDYQTAKREVAVRIPMIVEKSFRHSFQVNKAFQKNGFGLWIVRSDLSTFAETNFSGFLDQAARARWIRYSFIWRGITFGEQSIRSVYRLDKCVVVRHNDSSVIRSDASSTVFLFWTEVLLVLCSLHVLICLHQWSYRTRFSSEWEDKCHLSWLETRKWWSVTCWARTTLQCESLAHLSRRYSLRLWLMDTLCNRSAFEGKPGHQILAYVYRIFTLIEIGEMRRSWQIVTKAFLLVASKEIRSSNGDRSSEARQVYISIERIFFSSSSLEIRSLNDISLIDGHFLGVMHRIFLVNTQCVMETKIVSCFLIRLELFGIHRADSRGESCRFLISSASAWAALAIDYIPG